MSHQKPHIRKTKYGRPFLAGRKMPIKFKLREVKQADESEIDFKLFKKKWRKEEIYRP